MAEHEVSTGTPPTPTEHVAILLQHAHLNLPDAYKAELVEAYAYVERMVGRIRQGRNRADEPAHVFNPCAFDSQGA